MHHAFKYISLTSTSRLRRETSWFDVLWRTLTYDDEFSFPFLNLDKNTFPGKVACIWHIERVQIDAINLKERKFVFLATFSLPSSSTLLKVPNNYPCWQFEIQNCTTYSNFIINKFPKWCRCYTYSTDHADVGRIASLAMFNYSLEIKRQGGLRWFQFETMITNTGYFPVIHVYTFLNVVKYHLSKTKPEQMQPTVFPTYSKTLFTWSWGPRLSGVGFFCFVSPRAWKQKKPTPLDWGPPLHVNRP